MKKLILILAILVVASPAFAVLDVNIVKLTGNQVQIRYTGADGNNLPRGFALTFEVSSTADVCGISKYKSGESVAGADPCSRGYGIYPARITFPDPPGDQNVPSSWGNPLADQNDPPSGIDQNLPSKYFVLEFGSLYAPVTVGSPNAPGADGNLCVLSYDPNGSTSFTIRMLGEGQYRITGGVTATAGVVFEDGSTADVNKSLTIATADCYNDPCAARQTAWTTFSKPDCWCYKRQCRGDADSTKQLALYWVYSTDFAILKAAYQKSDTQLKTIVSNGRPGICADFCRDKQLNLYRVYSNDLTRMKAYYQKSEALTPICDSNVINFWKP